MFLRARRTQLNVPLLRSVTRIVRNACDNLLNKNVPRLCRVVGRRVLWCAALTRVVHSVPPLRYLHLNMEEYASSEVLDNDFYGLEEGKGLDETEHTADPLLLDLFPNPQEDFPEFSEEFPLDDAVEASDKPAVPADPSSSVSGDQKKRKRTPEEKAERKRRRKERKEKKRVAREQREKGHESQHQTSQKNDSKTSPQDKEQPVKLSFSKQQELQRRARKKRKQELTEDEAAETARILLQRMRDAADEDKVARTEGRPALAKLKLLNEACSEIAKPKWMYWYLREGACEVFARWLAPYSGKMLPNITVRAQILRLLHKIPVTMDHMHGTELGFRLVQLWKFSDKHDEDRTLIQSLVRSLLRPVFGLDTYRPVAEPISATPFGSSADHSALLGNHNIRGSRRLNDPSQLRNQAPLQPSYMQHGFKMMPPSDIAITDIRKVKRGGRQSTLARLNRIISRRKTPTSFRLSRQKHVTFYD